MKCERCGTTAMPNSPFESVYVVGRHVYELCQICQEGMEEITEHAVQGGCVQLVDDDGRAWTYWVHDGRPLFSLPEEVRLGERE